MPTVAKTLTAFDIAWAEYDFGLYIAGTNFNDNLVGTGGADEIHGRAGNDQLYGEGGDDFVFGEQGSDLLVGGAGSDRLDGGSGDDWLEGGAGADMLIGGDGFDTVSYFLTSHQSVYVNLATNTGVFGEAQGDTFSGIEKVVGSGSSDALFADDSGIVLEGAAGDDLLVGGAGLDKLLGGPGDDILEGGLGLDILSGGSGADHFVLNWNDGPDIITDFQPGVDKIELGNGFNNAPFGSDGVLWTGTQPPTTYPYGGNDMLFYDTDDQQLFQVSHAWNSPYEAELTLLATLSNGVQLQAGDFILG